MTRRPFLRRALAIATALMTAAAAPATFAQSRVTLRYSNWLPPTHVLHHNVIKPWIEEVSQVTQGRVKIEVLPKVVGSVPTQFDVVRDGLADLSFVIHGYTPGRFRGHELLELPFLGSDAEALGAAAWRIHHKHLKELNEFAGTVPLAIFTQGPAALFTTPGPIESIEQFKGLKLRVGGPAQIPLMNVIGAVAIQRPVSQLYEVMSTGVVDGAVLGREAVKNFNLGRTIRHGLLLPGGFSNLGQSIVVNERAWNRISAADREAIMRISGEALSRRFGAQFESMDRAGIEDVIAHGGKVTQANPKLVEDLRQAFKIADDAWFDKAKAAGLKDPQKVLADFRNEVATLQSK
ncbi:TRAP transporter substrate-binding protein [Caldimonas thermodepolymerans]|uniref:TRAP-type C4-dicarboxylate transport system substrate-binding protein n=1 Tax=Caldimonas thermodepolymerans TaxID=215580 RepID=A0AA46HWN9_9BURK|nr:TRAP transporter substrate-binding protein [Caldimonas thermodepolymerans]TCP08323.1 TRAP-type C4-dicarboxylate transport system substrate-binding protein [Caldimonas thermodepolymerans]UZG48564.1 TRAP transporter substrate-binding protein [Caldimonas thermodepolymerans]